MTNSPYGLILSLHQVEQAIINLADRWFTEYLAEAERQNGFPPRHFPELKDKDVVNDFEKWPEEHLPFLLVMYMGLSERPRRYGDGSYSTRSLFGASIIVSTNSRRNTRIAAAVYAAAFEAMVVQHRGLERPDLVQGLTWIDSRPSELPPESSRSLGAHIMLFEVDVKNVVSEGGRPPAEDPRPDPYEPPEPLPHVDPIADRGIRIDIVKEITP